jgi:hypothetical protein
VNDRVTVTVTTEAPVESVVRVATTVAAVGRPGSSTRVAVSRTDCWEAVRAGVPAATNPVGYSVDRFEFPGTWYQATWSDRARAPLRAHVSIEIVW